MYIPTYIYILFIIYPVRPFLFLSLSLSISIALFFWYRQMGIFKVVYWKKTTKNYTMTTKKVFSHRVATVVVVVAHCSCLYIYCIIYALSSSGTRGSYRPRKCPYSFIDVCPLELSSSPPMTVIPEQWTQIYT